MPRREHVFCRSKNEARQKKAQYRKEKWTLISIRRVIYCHTSEATPQVTWGTAGWILDLERPEEGAL